MQVKHLNLCDSKVVFFDKNRVVIISILLYYIENYIKFILMGVYYMTFETAQMHTEKAHIVEQLKAVVIVTEDSKIEQTPIHNLDEVNNLYSINGHLQKWRAVL